MTSFVDWLHLSNPSPPAGPLDYIHDSVTEYPAACLVGVVALAALTYYVCSRVSKPPPLSNQGSRRVIPPPKRPPPPTPPMENPANCNNSEDTANLEVVFSKRVRIDPTADSKEKLLFQVRGEINKLTAEDKIAIAILVLNWWKQQGFITEYDPSNPNIFINTLGHQMKQPILLTEKDVFPQDARGTFSIAPSLSENPTFMIQTQNKLLAYLFLKQLNAILGIEPHHYQEQKQFSARWSLKGYLSLSRREPAERNTRLTSSIFKKS